MLKNSQKPCTFLEYLSENSHESKDEKWTTPIIVKKKAPKNSWTNRTTKLIEKYCNIHQQICKFSQRGQLCKLTRQQQYTQNKKIHSPTKLSILCRSCKQTKVHSFFYPNPLNKSGRTSICKPCKKNMIKLEITLGKF